MWIVALGGSQPCTIISIYSRDVQESTLSVSMASFWSYIFITFHLSHDVHVQPYICPTSHLAFFVGCRSNFHSLFLFKLFRKMMKKPKRLQKKDSWLLGICYSHTGFTATITQYYRSVQRIHPAWLNVLRPKNGLSPCFWRGSRVSLWNSGYTEAPTYRKIVLSPFVATIFLSPFSF